MTISFYLHRPKKEDATIRIKVNYGAFIMRRGKKIYKPYERTLPFVTKTKYWSTKKQRVKETYDYPESVEINIFLDKIEAVIKQYSTQCMFNGIPLSEDGFRQAINKSLGFEEKKEIKYFSEVIEEMITESRNGKRLTQSGNKIKPNTIRKYDAALYHLTNYEHDTFKVQVKDVNKHLAKDLQIYFNDIQVAQNTKATQFNVYRTALNYAIEKGYTEDTSFKEVSVPEVLTDAIALTVEEIEKIFRLKITDPILNLHRDVFVVGVWSMLRFSDYSHLDKWNILEDENMLKIFTAKTERPVYIPLHWQLREIVQKHGQKLPRLKHVQVFNRSLKEIGKMAEIDRPTEVREFIGGRTTKKIVPRYSLISSHTARRSGATMLYLAGIPKKQIMLLTDHSKEVHFDRYIRIDKYANAKSLSGHDIFNKRPTATL